jgi:uncharacterized protein
VSTDYIPRIADRILEEMISTHRAILIVGPRATGKTTTAGRLAADRVELLQAAQAAAVAADPLVALTDRPAPLLIDEWQVVPSCLQAIKQIVDTTQVPGQFIVTGSVRGDIDSPIWPGTGRLVRLAMYGLTEREVEGRVTDRSWLERLIAGDPMSTHRTTETLRDYVGRALRSGYPEAALFLDERARSRWLSSYVDQVVARDAFGQASDRDPIRLRRYLEALALHTAETIDDTKLYTAANINKDTARAYHRLLQNLLILDELPAWTTNRLKRLTLAPKRHLVDPALLVGILGVTVDSVLRDGGLLGQVIDSFVTAQIRAEAALMAPAPRMHHLRTAQGRQEIDLILEIGHRQLVAIEIKATSNPGPDDAKHLRWIKRELGDDVIAAVLFHSGPMSFSMDEGVMAMPISALWS